MKIPKEIKIKISTDKSSELIINILNEIHKTVASLEGRILLLEKRFENKYPVFPLEKI